jgi:phosphohistidine phosphatase
LKNKPDYYYYQSGVIPYRFKKKEMQILLITTRRGKEWTIPKGIIEERFEDPESAVKEAFEEAGLIGNIDETISWQFRFRKWGGICDVKLYPMQVEKELEDFPENKVRAKKWLSVKDAVKLVKFEKVKECIKELEKLHRDLYNDL